MRKSPLFRFRLWLDVRDNQSGIQIWCLIQTNLQITAFLQKLEKSSWNLAHETLNSQYCEDRHCTGGGVALAHGFRALSNTRRKSHRGRAMLEESYSSHDHRRQRELQKGQDVYKRNMSPVAYFLQLGPAARSFHSPPNKVTRLGSHQ